MSRKYIFLSAVFSTVQCGRWPCPTSEGWAILAACAAGGFKMPTSLCENHSCTRKIVFSQWILQSTAIRMDPLSPSYRHYVYDSYKEDIKRPAMEPREVSCCKICFFLVDRLSSIAHWNSWHCTIATAVAACIYPTSVGENVEVHSCVSFWHRRQKSHTLVIFQLRRTTVIRIAINS